MVLEAIIDHKNETSEVYDFKIDQKWGIPPIISQLIFS